MNDELTLDRKENQQATQVVAEDGGKFTICNLEFSPKISSETIETKGCEDFTFRYGIFGGAGYLDLSTPAKNDSATATTVNAKVDQK